MNNIMKKLNMYIGYENNSREEGAVLVFAHTAKEARKLAYPFIESWFDNIEWIDMRAQRLRGKEHLYAEADQEKLKAGIPHVIESPRSCRSCCLWGSVIGEDGLCEYCRGE